MSDKLIIFSAPSGAGKTTIVKRLLNENLNLEFSVSACSRSMRQNEKEGIDYYFISVEEFNKRIQNNDFIEWEQVYEGSYYGTLKSEVSRIAAKGNIALFDVDVIGGLNIKKLYKHAAISIFVMPPSLEILKIRLFNRQSDTEESLRKRIAKAEKELGYASAFDAIIVNDNLDDAVAQAKKIISDFAL